jgi:hypothetical protein
MNKQKIHAKLLLITLIAMIFMLQGCASAKLNVLKPVTSQLGTVSLTLLDKTAKKVSDEDINNLKAAFSNSLQKLGVTLISNEKNDVPTIVGQIQEYDKGSQPLRYFIGFGAGTGNMKTAWTVTDPSGTEVGSCSIDGSISAGVFGGNFYSVHEEAAKAFVKFFTGAN